jgi:hypothetical protein
MAAPAAPGPQRLGGLDRRTLGKDVVGLEREVRMLLGRADGVNDPVVSAQVRLSCIQLRSRTLTVTRER